MIKKELDLLMNLYSKMKKKIKSRKQEFENLWKTGRDEDLYAELVFCQLTPQSKAKSCWAAVENIKKKGILLSGKEKQILNELIGVRFKYKKAKYVIEARKLFFDNNKLVIKKTLSDKGNVFDMREWLVKNVKGYGYKEASHFLRNIGLGKEITILDRHILRNLVLFGVIKKIPDSINKKKYIEIEKAMIKFSKKINIPLDELDLLLWCKEAGEVFK